MKREFLLNIALLLVLNFVIKPLYIFGVDRQIQLQLPEDYTLFSTIFNSFLVLKVFSDFGMQSQVTRKIAENPSNFRSIFSSYFATISFLNLAFLFMAMGLYFAFFSNVMTIEMAFFICLIPISNTFMTFLRANMAGLGYYRTDSWLSVLDRTFLLITLGGILLGFIPTWHINIWDFIIFQIISNTLVCLVVVFLLRHQIFPLKINISFRKIWLIILEASPVALSILLMSIYYRADSFWVKQFAPSDWVEINSDYFKIFRIIDALNMIGMLFAGLLLPMFARLGKSEDALKLMHLSSKIIIIICLLGILPMAIFTEDLLQLLYGNGSEALVGPFRWFLWSFFGMSLIYIFSTILTANGLIGKLNPYFLAAILLSILLHGLLDAKYGLWGAVIANTSAILFVGISSVRVSFVHFPSDLWNGINVGRLLVLATISILVGMAIKHNTELPWWLQAILLNSLVLLFAIFLKIFSINNVIFILKRNVKL